MAGRQTVAVYVSGGVEHPTAIMGLRCRLSYERTYLWESTRVNHHRLSLALGESRYG